MSTLLADITYYTPDARPAPEERPDFNALPLKNWSATVTDLREHGPTSLSEEGFQFVEAPASVKDWRSLDELDAVYGAEMLDFVKQLTGAKETRLSGKPGLRSSAPLENRGGAMMTGAFVHADVSALGAEDFLDRYIGEDADRWRQGRYAIYNVWRSFSDVPQDVPLGMCDTRSTVQEDVQLCNISLPVRGQGDRSWETIAYVHNPDHKWYYASYMKPHEAYVFRTFDSAKPHNPVPHSAFANPEVTGVPPRESVELRVWALLED